MRNLACPRSVWRSLAGAIVVILLAPIASHAAETYRIEGIPVEATAESGVVARETAIAGGQREGLTRLMRRLTSPADHARLPDVATVSIERYVNSFEIAEDRVGPNQYLGVINVSYVASEVRGLLSSAGIPFVTRRSDPILVVPLTVANGEPDAWAEASPWRTAWIEGIDSATVIVVSLPLGDLADIAAASPGALAAGDPAALEALGTRYGALTVIVASASAVDSTLSGPVTVDLRRADDWANPIFRRTLEVPPDVELATVLKPVVADAVIAIEDDWKQRTAEQAAAVTTLAATVPLAGLASWVQIRRELTALPEVRWVSVESFTQSQARITIGHLGDLERLTAAVGRAGLALTEETDGWQLRPADVLVGPSAVPADLVVTP